MIDPEILRSRVVAIFEFGGWNCIRVKALAQHLRYPEEEIIGLLTGGKRYQVSKKAGALWLHDTGRGRSKMPLSQQDRERDAA